MLDYNKFNKQLPEDMKEQVEAASNGGDYEDVPVGAYEVELNTLELKESSTGKPMLSAWLQIIGGNYDKQMLFYNQVINNAFGIHNANEFLKSLESGVDVVWQDDYEAYDNMVSDIKEAVDASENTFKCEYSKSKKDFGIFKITEIYEN